MESSARYYVLFFILILLLARAILVTNTAGPADRYKYQRQNRKRIAWVSAIGGIIILLLVFYFNKFLINPLWFIGSYMLSSVFFARKYGAVRGIIYTSNVLGEEIKTSAPDVGFFDICVCVILGLAYSMSSALTPLEEYLIWILLTVGTAIGVTWYELKWYKIWLKNTKIGNSRLFEDIVNPPKKKIETTQHQTKPKHDIDWAQLFLRLSHWILLLIAYLGIPLIVGYKSKWPLGIYGITLCIFAFLAPPLISKIRTLKLTRRGTKLFVSLLAATSEKNAEKASLILNKCDQLQWTSDYVVETFFKISKTAFDDFIEVYRKGNGCRTLIRSLWEKEVSIRIPKYVLDDKIRDDRLVSIWKLIKDKSVPVDHRATFLGFFLLECNNEAVSAFFKRSPELLTDSSLLKALKDIHGLQIGTK